VRHQLWRNDCAKLSMFVSELLGRDVRLVSKDKAFTIFAIVNFVKNSMKCEIRIGTEWIFDICTVSNHNEGFNGCGDHTLMKG
jgi:hypothetical protein